MLYNYSFDNFPEEFDLQTSKVRSPSDLKLFFEFNHAKDTPIIWISQCEIRV